MKLLLASFAASILAPTTAQFSIGSPQPGDTITPGQDITVQIVMPIATTEWSYIDQIALVIGVLDCSSSCSAPSADLGEIVFTGKFQPQGSVNSINCFEDFTFQVPTDLSGPLATIQVQHIYLTTSSQHAYPTVEYTSVQVSISNSTSTGGSLSTFTIHPQANFNKCVGIQGGVYENGAPVDIYDCNESETQNWLWNGNGDGSALMSINPADLSQWCLDAGDPSQWANGVKMKIWQCFAGLPQQTWNPIQISGPIELLANDYFVLDLTNGNVTNQNILQLWTWSSGDNNQEWVIGGN